LGANDTSAELAAGGVTELLDLPAFARLHALRAPLIAWFFGAGASAAGGGPTASQMTWDFKARIYASSKGLSLAGLDLADPAVRKRIQSHFGVQPGSPAEGSDDDEIAGLLEPDTTTASVAA